jgi:hypothetical protein
MPIAESSKCRWMLPITVGLVLALSLSFPNPLHAQKGYNAVCSSAAGCTSVTSSNAFIDASALAGADVCAKINTALGIISSTGGVIDARGATAGTCANSPWNGITSPSPAVILLPSGTITIPSTWVLPNYTRIFGDGERGNSGTSGTVITAAGTFTAGTAMIQFGALTSGSCTSAPLFGISIQDVMLNGDGLNIVGILNECAQETSYVERVNLYQIAGTGLEVMGNQAQNSGPYADITCNPGTAGGTSNISSSTTCVNINGTGDLRGVHGLTATVGSDGVTCPGSTCPSAAVYLDSNDTTIEDAHFEGFVTGILVGSYSSSTSSAKSDTIINVNGGGSSSTGGTSNVVEISAATNTTSGNPNVSDLSITGVSWSTNPASSTYSVDDVLTSTTLSDRNVALYVLGEVISTTMGTGYSRFTTSNSTATWGAGALGTGKPNSTCTPGALFSNTTGAKGNILFVCGATAWVDLY